MANTLIHHFLENSAARFPDKVALIHDQTRATYRQVNTDSDNLSAFLVTQGVEAGDRIVILLENGYEYVVTYYGILKAGAVAVPLSTDLKADGLDPLLAELEPVGIFSSYRFENLLQASDLAVPSLRILILHQSKKRWDDHRLAIFSFQEALKRTPVPVKQKINTRPSDLANIIYTSSSTGRPKGAMLSHSNIVANTMAICDYLHLSQRDIHMVVLPFFYVMGQSLLNTHIAVGGTVVINNRFAYSASVLNQMVVEKVTGFSGVPSTYAYLLHRSPLKDYKNKLVHLRYCSQAGGHMAIAHQVGLRNALPGHTQIYIMYGATEASARLTYLEPDQFEKKMGSIGKPLPGVSVTILDNQTVEVKQGLIGELNVSGPNIMSGYWRDAETTARALGPYGYRTGDLGYQDADGYLYLAGRKNDTIKVGGHRINTMEVEDLLLATELIIDTAVFGVEDDLLGKKLSALIMLKDKTIDEKMVLKACHAIIPKYKIPSTFLTVGAIPKKANGKVDRLKCLKMISDLQKE